MHMVRSAVGPSENGWGLPRFADLISSSSKRLASKDFHSQFEIMGAFVYSALWPPYLNVAYVGSAFRSQRAATLVTNLHSDGCLSASLPD